MALEQVLAHQSGEESKEGAKEFDQAKLENKYRLRAYDSVLRVKMQVFDNYNESCE